MIIAAIRTGDVNFPLFLHVLGAMLFMGALFAVILTTAMSWRRTDDNVGLTRLSLKTVLLGVFPAYLVMRVGAQWVEVKEGLDDVEESPAWIGVGYITADLAALLVIISMILAGIGLRKMRNGGGEGIGRAVGVLAAIMAVASLVALWAMSAKPV